MLVTEAGHRGAAGRVEDLAPVGARRSQTPWPPTATGGGLAQVAVQNAAAPGGLRLRWRHHRVSLVRDILRKGGEPRLGLAQARGAAVAAERESRGGQRLRGRDRAGQAGEERRACVAASNSRR